MELFPYSEDVFDTEEISLEERWKINNYPMAKLVETQI